MRQRGRNNWLGQAWHLVCPWARQAQGRGITFSASLFFWPRDSKCYGAASFKKMRCVINSEKSSIHRLSRCFNGLISVSVEPMMWPSTQHGACSLLIIEWCLPIGFEIECSTSTYAFGIWVYTSFCTCGLCIIVYIVIYKTNKNCDLLLQFQCHQMMDNRSPWPMNEGWPFLQPGQQNQLSMNLMMN